MKRHIKTVIALLLCTGLVITCVKTDILNQNGDTVQAQSSHKAKATKAAAKKGEGTGAAYKNETVFVTSDATGAPTSILVSDWLKNTKHFQTITDATTLKDIENVKGNQELKLDGSNLSVEAAGSDIYYRGNLPTDTKLPVALKVTYRLDGKEITAKELKGASGKLEVSIKYTNQTSSKQIINGKEYNVCVPFLASTILMIPSEQLSDITIKNGKVLESGEMDIIVGYGLPGINQSLNLSTGLFTDTVDFSATVKNYKPSMLMTYLSSEPFASSDIENAVDVNSLTSSLQSATANSAILGDIKSMDDINGLMDKMKESFKTLDDGAIQLHTGIAKVDANMELLKAGLKDAKSGSSLLSSTMTSVYTKAGDLSKGAASLDAGIRSLSSSLGGMYQSISSSINKSHSDLNAVNAGILALTSIPSPSPAQLAQLEALKGNKAALEGALSALTTIKTQMDQGKLTANLAALAAGSSQVKSGAQAMYSGLGMISTKTTELAGGISKLENGAVLLKDGTGQLLSGSQKLADGTKLLKDSMQGNLPDLLNSAKAIQAAAKEYNTFTQLTKDGEGKVSFIIKSE